MVRLSRNGRKMGCLLASWLGSFACWCPQCHFWDGWMHGSLCLRSSGVWVMGATRTELNLGDKLPSLLSGSFLGLAVCFSICPSRPPLCQLRSHV
uniref:Secreted protein n=1 Tax=Cyanistes caeruleus TaxID=156563 RepID=A0A8C0Z7T5_CYACU